MMQAGWSGILGRVAMGLVLGYALMLVILFVLQRRLMYFPDTSSPGPVSSLFPGASELASRTDDGISLVHWYHPPADDEKPVVVFFHGNAGNKADRVFKAAAFTGAGLGVLLVEYRGYGGSAGKPTEEGLYADARSALAALAGQDIGLERMVFYGESIGTGVAVEMAAEFAPAALILEAPLASSAGVAMERFPLVFASLLMKDKYDNLAKIPLIASPVMIIHGDADDTVSIWNGLRLFNAATGPKKALFVPGAGHNDLFAFGVDRDILSFIALNMGRRRAQDELRMEDEEDEYAPIP